jgi:hypothetical protein
MTDVVFIPRICVAYITDVMFSYSLSSSPEYFVFMLIITVYIILQGLKVLFGNKPCGFYGTISSVFLLSNY